jgi:hypothetical protein
MPRSAVITATLVLAASALSLPACSGGRILGLGGQFAPMKDNQAFEGVWISERGRSLTVTHQADGQYRLRILGQGREDVYDTTLLGMDGKTVAEVLVNRDEVERAGDVSTAAPVFLYSRIEFGPDQFTSRQLQADWLETKGRAAGLSVVEVREMGGAPLTTGRVMAAGSDRARMHRLLIDATQDDSAWGPAETFTRTTPR